MPIGPDGQDEGDLPAGCASLLDRACDLVTHHHVEIGDRVAADRLELLDATRAGAWLTASGGCEQHASILARSHPRGRKPSIIEPANVVKRFMEVWRCSLFDGDDDFTGQRARAFQGVFFQEALGGGGGR